MSWSLIVFPTTTEQCACISTCCNCVFSFNSKNRTACYIAVLNSEKPPIEILCVFPLGGHCVLVSLFQCFFWTLEFHGSDKNWRSVFNISVRSVEPSNVTDMTSVGYHRRDRRCVGGICSMGCFGLLIARLTSGLVDFFGCSSVLYCQSIYWFAGFPIFETLAHK